MAHPTPTVLTALAITVSLAAGMVAEAQPTPPRPRPNAERPNADMRLEIEQRMAARRAQRNADLALVLRLTPAQTKALETFVATQTPPRRDMRGPDGGRPDRRALTTPQRLDERTRRDEARRAFDAKRAQGLRDFYAVLSPDQKQVFDALTRLRQTDRGGPMGGRGRGGPGPRGPGGPGGFGPPGGPGGPPPPR